MDAFQEPKIKHLCYHLNLWSQDRSARR